MWHGNRKPVLSMAVLAMGFSMLARAATCDVNADGSIDIADINAIVAATNQPATGPSDLRDANGDGVINALDARSCTVKCANARCAVTNSLPSSATIGVAGGVVGLPDGARINIPAGALATPTVISIAMTAPDVSALPPGGVFAGSVYALSPSGIQFQKPIVLTVPYERSKLPSHIAPDDVLVYVREGNARFGIAKSDTGDPDQESHGQSLDPLSQRITLNRLSFSHYAAIGVNAASQFAPSVLTSGAAQLTVLRPPGGMRTTRPQPTGCGNPSVNLIQRPSVVAGIIVHSTNNGTATNTFNSELGWATNDCNSVFAHYYIDRDGSIYQIVADNIVAQHVKTGRFSNTDAIGIELFNNVGEPYDGRQLSALIRLVDYLLVAHSLVRPVKDAVSGRVVRDAAADSVITHSENNPANSTNPKCPLAAPRCDPIGSFQSSESRSEIVRVNNLATLQTVPVAGGSAIAPGLMDIVTDVLASLDRDVNRPGRHTGVINTSGGTGAGLVAPDAGGSVTVVENMRQFGALAAATASNQNVPLIVPPGALVSTAPGTAVSDAIVLGTIRLASPLALSVYGTFYLGPTGRIVVLNGRNGGNVALDVRGSPILHGLLETTGMDSDGTQAAGRGGNVNVRSAMAAALLLPTIVTRGGDSSTFSFSGGAGGNVSVTAETSQLFVGGGVGLGGTSPPMREQATSVAALPPRFVGAFMPPPPPFNVGSAGVKPTAAGQRLPLMTLGSQSGFTRGLLTSGGSGGFGGPPAGSGGGAGGDIAITTSGRITFRDVDLVTGSDVETVFADIFLSDGFEHRYCAPTGSLGGKGTSSSGTSGSHGGLGGAAGDILVMGSPTLVPAVASTTTIASIPGFDVQLPAVGDVMVNCGSTFTYTIGNVRQAAAAGANTLYRLRVDATGTGTAGGSGGIPGGRPLQNQFPGRFGAKGTSGAIVGIPK